MNTWVKISKEIFMKKFVSSFMLVSLLVAALSGTALAGGTKEAQAPQLKNTKKAAMVTSALATGVVAAGFGGSITYQKAREFRGVAGMMNDKASMIKMHQPLGEVDAETKASITEFENSAKELSLRARRMSRVSIPLRMVFPLLSMGTAISAGVTLYDAASNDALMSGRSDKSLPSAGSAPITGSELSSAPSARGEHQGTNF